MKRRLTLGKPADRVLGGVCSGLADYFKIDPVLVRAAFVIAVLIFGVGFLPYVILYVVMPKSPRDI